MGRKGTLLRCWWECKLVQSLWKTVWRFLKKLKIELPHGGFLDSSVGKESTCNTEDPVSIPGLGRSPREGIGYPLHYSWASLVAQLVKSLLQCRRPGFNPWVGKIPWRREKWPNPVFLLENTVDYIPWGCKELDTTEQLSLSFQFMMCTSMFMASFLSTISLIFPLTH